GPSRLKRDHARLPTRYGGEAGEGRKRAPSLAKIHVGRILPLTRRSLCSRHPLPARFASRGEGADRVRRPIPRRADSRDIAARHRTAFAIPIHLSNSPVRSRGAFSAPGVCFSLRSPGMRGGRSTERRTGARAKHPFGVFGHARRL